MCSALVRSPGLCRVFAYRTRHTQRVGSLLIERDIHSGVARLFVGVAYVGSLLIERSIQSL